MIVSSARERRVMDAGSGIVVVDVVKLFLTAKRSARSVSPSWSASPMIEFEPSFFLTRSRS